MTRRDRETDSALRETADGPSMSEITGRPNFNGDLNIMLESDPGFRGRLIGYDRLQVSNYVTWVETELLSQHRACEEALRANAEIAGQLGACQAELRQLKEQVAEEASADPARISERVHNILQLAADEAAEIRAAREADADQVLAQARSLAAAAATDRAEAQRTLESAIAEQQRAEAETAQRCGELRDMADRTLADARGTAAAVYADAEALKTRTAADSEAELHKARAEAERILTKAAHERARLDAHAAQARKRSAAAAAEHAAEAEAAAAARLSAIEQQVDALNARRDDAVDGFRQLQGQVATILHAVQRQAESVSAAL